MSDTLSVSYRELLEAIIKKQSSIVGLGVAIKRARNVAGLVLDDTGHITESTSTDSAALEGLVNQYKALSGSVGLDFCRQATAEFAGTHADFHTPTFLA